MIIVCRLGSYVMMIFAPLLPHKYVSREMETVIVMQED